MSSNSTGVEPPTPHLLSEYPLSPHKPSLLQKLKLKRSSPPIAFDTQRRNHKRSSSFSDWVSQILPSHRQEKGHTERKQYGPNRDQSPVDLVFGVPTPPVLHNEKGTHDMGLFGVYFFERLGCLVLIALLDPIQKTRSWSPRRTAGDCDENPSRRGDRLGHRGGHGRARARVGGRTGLGISGSWSRGFGVNDSDKTQLYQQPDNEEESKAPLLSCDSPELENIEMTKTQKMFEDKRVRREQRRSLRESGDFLGVQGANPRTGYWDVSSGTSSSEPSQMSEETKKKLYEQAKNIEEQKQKYEEAKAKHEAELVRVQTLRENKKKDKEKRKKTELKMKQRRHGKWKLSEDGWHSLAEPDLSPITQSVAGSPGKGKFHSLAF